MPLQLRHLDPRVAVGVARLQADGHRAQVELAAGELDRVQRRGHQILEALLAAELVVLPGVVDGEEAFGAVFTSGVTIFLCSPPKGPADLGGCALIWTLCVSSAAGLRSLR